MSNENKTRTLSFRLAEDDYEQLLERCRVAELTKSRYLRYLIRIPMLAEGTEDNPPDAVVLDKKSIRKMSKELTRWGYHYNQAVHAMNSINYYVTHGKADSDILDGKAAMIEVELAAVNENAERIIYELVKLQDATVIEE